MVLADNVLSREFETHNRYWARADSCLESNRPDAFHFNKHDMETDKARLFSMPSKAVALKVKQARAARFLEASVPFLTDDSVDYWRYVISEAFVLTLYTYNYYRALGRKQLYAEYEQQLMRYKYHLNLLDKKSKGIISEPFYQSGHTDWSPVSYLGFSFALWYRNQLEEMALSPSVATRAWMDELNWHRLYWVWAGGNGGLLASLFDLDWIKDHFKNHDRASKNLEAPVAFLGYVSWILYYFRFGINLWLMIKHTVANPWMNDVELNIPWQQRLKAQWDQRKFSMLNDVVWATVNLSTIYWLTNNASLMMGAYGGLLTIGLMMFDVAMSIWQYRENKEKHISAMRRVKEKIRLLAQKKQELAKALGLKDTDELDFGDKVLLGSKDYKKLISLDRQEQALQEELNLLKFEWKYEKKRLKAMVAFAIIFVVAMALMYTPIFPVLLPFLHFSQQFSAWGVFIGCLFAVGVTAGQTVYEGNLEEAKCQERMANIDSKLARLYRQFEVLKKGSLDANNKDALRVCLLECKQLSAERAYLNALVTHEGLKKNFSATTQLLFPAVVFAALFLPLPWMALAITLTIILTIVLRAAIVGREPQPAPKDSVQLTKTEYQNPEKVSLPPIANAVIKNEQSQGEPDLMKKKVALSRYRLFSHPDTTADAPMDEDVQPSLVA